MLKYVIICSKKVKKVLKVIKESDLSEKQIIFAKEYLVCMNATESAIKAGYSKKTAHSQGCRLLKNVKVKSYVEQCLQERASKLDITPNRILEELGSIAFFNINNIFDGDRIKSINELPKEVARAISSIKLRKEKIDGDDIPSEVMEIKANDKLKAIEMLMRYLGMFEIDNKQGKEETNIKSVKVTYE